MDDAQIIQDLIEGARRAGADVQFQGGDDFFKTAGAVQALADMGMDKEAIWGAVAGLGARALPWIGKGLSKLWGATGSKVVGATAKPLGWAGQKLTGAVGQVSPGAANLMTTIGKGSAREAAGFGLLSGGLNAATAEPGDRLSAFGRGFAGGALGGAAWRMGGNAARMGLGRALGPERMGNLYRAGRHGWFGGGLGGFGAKAVTTGVPLAGALGASMMMPTFESQQAAQQRPSAMPYLPAQMYGTGRMIAGQ